MSSPIVLLWAALNRWSGISQRTAAALAKYPSLKWSVKCSQASSNKRHWNAILQIWLDIIFKIFQLTLNTEGLQCMWNEYISAQINKSHDWGLVVLSEIIISTKCLVNSMGIFWTPSVGRQFVSSLLWDTKWENAIPVLRERTGETRLTQVR